VRVCLCVCVCARAGEMRYVCECEDLSHSLCLIMKPERLDTFNFHSLCGSYSCSHVFEMLML